MDVSTFMTGYFVGLFAGAGVFVWWTYKFGRFLPKEWPLTRQKIANGFNRLRGKKIEAVSFSSRRETGSVTPAE